MTETKTKTKTFFPNLAASFDWIGMEKKVLNDWYRQNVFQQLQQKLSGSTKRFSLIDGPITANNPMGVHHARGRTLKDIYQRYWAMRGYNQRFQNGFDCQGLWVEVEVEKGLGFNSKLDIESYGIEKFIDTCKQRVNRYSEVITEQSKKLGQFMDWPNSYFTHSDKNIEMIWYFLAVCHRNGWLYRKEKVMPWCPRCATSLSAHEMADSYKEIEHQSVYLKLPVIGEKDRYFLVWTTTPWTLTANAALAVNPNLEYVVVKQGNEELILAKSTRRVLEGSYQILEEFRGSTLVNLEYLPPFGELEQQKNVKHKVISWKDVVDSEGSGIVHIAPGCGEEDYELGELHNLSVISPIDENGYFLEGFGSFKGSFAGTSSSLVFDLLKEKQMLYKIEPYRHRYPVCWRCKTELLFRLVSEWFISTKEIRPKLIEATKSVHWIPDYSGKRMVDWLNNMGDWCISRKRYWGLPLPFYECSHCNEVTVVDSKKTLLQLTVNTKTIENLPELHRPWIDKVTIHCPKCGSVVNRIKEVGDCWLDAGVVPFSTLNYLENRSFWEKWFPADVVIEMIEQTRLWFYSMLFMSVTLEGRPPYKTVIAFDEVRNEDGSEMHKSEGTYIEFNDAVKVMGADVIRWLFASQSIDKPLLFGYKLAHEIKKRFVPLWNAVRFFCNFASLDIATVEQLEVPPTHLLDRWILSRLAETVSQYHKAMENYDVQLVTNLLESFIDDLTNGYIRLSRRRFWKQEESLSKYSAYSTLYKVLMTLTKLLAPIIPFLADYIYGILKTGLTNQVPSIHLTSMPVEESFDKQLLNNYRHFEAVVRLGLLARNKAGIKLRQPLKTMIIKDNFLTLRNDQEFQNLLKESLNVKEVKFRKTIDKRLFLNKKWIVVDSKDGELSIGLLTLMTPGLVKEGIIREIVRRIQFLRKEHGLAVNDRIITRLYTEEPVILESLREYKAYLKNETLSSKIVFSKEPLLNIIQIYGSRSIGIEIVKV